MTGRPTDYGSRLNEKWNVGAEHALYHREGTFYMPLNRFPGALFDPHGYVVYDTEEDYRNCEHLNIGERVNVPEGIRSIPSYQRMAD